MTCEPKHIIRADGHQEWYVNDQLHRTAGPAVIKPDGYQAWFTNGLCHRLDGPARILANGTQEWWVDNQLHRTDGPARIWPNGGQEWWVNGLYITDKVKTWQQQQDVVWPWDPATQTQFVLTFL